MGPGAFSRDAEGHVTRKPKGYVGTDHETIGSDILAVVAAIRLPEQVLGTDMVQ